MRSFIALAVIPVLSFAADISIENKCGFEVFASTVSTDNGAAAPLSIAAGATHTETILETITGGVSIKVTDTIDDLSTPMQIEYTQNPGNGQKFYNLSFVDCARGQDASACAGHDGGLRMVCEGAKEFVCPPAGFCPDQSYYEPQPRPVEPNFACESGSNIRVTLCG